MILVKILLIWFIRLKRRCSSHNFAFVFFGVTTKLGRNYVAPSELHDFTKGKSTTTNLLACDRRIPTDVLYLNFTMAFDRLSRARLLLKLESFGPRGKLLAWIEDYLTGRSFVVRVGVSFSSEIEITRGIPQALVLGPLLFLFYVSDLRRVIGTSKLFYADDIKVYGNLLQNHKSLKDGLDVISQWWRDWFIPLNVEKGAVLHIWRNNTHLPYTIDGM